MLRHRPFECAKTRLCAVAFFLMLTSTCWADTEASRIPIGLAPVGSVGLGFGYRVTTSPYIGGEDYTDLVPMYLYEGRYLFGHGTSAGVHLIKNDSFVFDVLARYRFDRLDPDDDPFLRTLEKREQTVDGGIGAAWRGKWGSLRFEYVEDLLDRHNGSQMDLTYRYLFTRSRWLISPFIGAQFQDEDLVDYYYGVSEAESRPDLDPYVGDDATNIRYGVNLAYLLPPSWVIYANVAFSGIDDPILDSPLVEEDLLSEFFIGAAYNFGTVKAARNVPREPSHEWSWRVNYGYNAEHTFNEVVRGKLAPESDIDTRLAGVTFSKLLSGGHRIDWYGRFAAFRHFQKEFKDDFWEFDAYVMAMWKGYMPWSDEVAFRYGFGAGFSYAESVPIDEQIAQEERGRGTSHLLNYLEFQVDFPLDRILKRRKPTNCYTGLTVVHRSGIFGSADILGNVDGGSNVITLHLECLR